MKRHSMLVFHGKNRQECLLRDFDPADLFHTLLPFLLFLEELPLARDIPAVTLRQNVFSQCGNRIACNHLASDRRLNDNFKHLPRNELPQTRAEFFPPLVRLLTVDDCRKRIDGLPIKEYVELYKV